MHICTGFTMCLILESHAQLYNYLYCICTAVMTAEDTKAALRTFDEYAHLIKLVEPQCIQETLQTADIFPNNNPFIDATTLPTCTMMEKFLNRIRSCIEYNGAQKFLAFVNVLQTEGRYVVLGCHIFSK